MKQIEVTLKRDKECKGSVRFATDDEAAPITNVYVSRTIPEISHVATITIILQVGSAAAQEVKV